MEIEIDEAYHMVSDPAEQAPVAEAEEGPDADHEAAMAAMDAMLAGGDAE